MFVIDSLTYWSNTVDLDGYIIIKSMNNDKLIPKLKFCEISLTPVALRINQ